MHTLKPDGPHRPGKNLFSWSDSEAKLNSQFPRILKASSYLPSGPASRPVSQDYLRRWERCARDGSYVVNSAAGFNRCSSELQERIATNVTFLSSKISKGKAPKEVSEALRYIKDYVSFHQNVSVAMGTALQHLADSLFVNLANTILLRRDSYLEHVKNGIKLEHAKKRPMFVHGLFPDSVLATAEQDITKYESAGAAPGPGPGASQHSSWRGNYRFKPYERRDSHQGSGHSDQGHQPWRQFSRNRSRGRGRGRGSTLVFLRPEETSLINDNYCSTPTQLKSPLVRLDNKLNSVNQTVNCLVVRQRPKQTLKDPMFKKAVFCHNVVDHVQLFTGSHKGKA